MSNNGLFRLVCLIVLVGYGKKNLSRIIAFFAEFSRPIFLYETVISNYPEQMINGYIQVVPHNYNLDGCIDNSKLLAISSNLIDQKL